MNTTYKAMPNGFVLVAMGRYNEWQLWELPAEHKMRKCGYTHRLMTWDNNVQDIKSFADVRYLAH